MPLGGPAQQPGDLSFPVLDLLFGGGLRGRPDLLGHCGVPFRQPKQQGLCLLQIHTLDQRPDRSLPLPGAGRLLPIGIVQSVKDRRHMLAGSPFRSIGAVAGPVGDLIPLRPISTRYRSPPSTTALTTSPSRWSISTALSW